jgi:hypothetical protein
LSSYQPALEALEDRLVPIGVGWTIDTDPNPIAEIGDVKGTIAAKQKPHRPGIAPAPTRAALWDTRPKRKESRAARAFEHPDRV